MPERPLLLIDVDGVISLYGFNPANPPAGHFQFVDGITHFLSATAGPYLRELADDFELAWCTGWEEKANEYLLSALGLPDPLAHLSFDDAVRSAEAHWKLAAIDGFAAAERPVAWVDDAHDHRCHEWAEARSGPTLLVATDPSIGLTAEHVTELRGWATEVSGRG